jgi:hypothetical protein
VYTVTLRKVASGFLQSLSTLGVARWAFRSSEPRTSFHSSRHDFRDAVRRGGGGWARAGARAERLDKSGLVRRSSAAGRYGAGQPIGRLARAEGSRLTGLGPHAPDGGFGFSELCSGAAGSASTLSAVITASVTGFSPLMILVR